ncbi:lytic polysaccharide monooxygenase [bacterium]|nr:lytic polysaccharide monooxygenase [bacterium]
MKKLVVLALALYAQDVFAHANILAGSAIPPRNTLANKTGPCGVARNVGTQTTTNLTPGQTLTITFQETIDHPGYYQIWFSPNADDSGMVLLRDNIPDIQGGAMPHNYSTTVTVPSTPCANCTIRMIQVMAENPNVPTYYYSCSNVQIAAVAGPSPSPSPSASNTPVPPVPTSSGGGINCGN